MNVSEFVKERKRLRDKLDKAKKKIDIEYGRVVDRFIKTNSPVERNTVYELVENGTKRRGFSRFVIYDFDILTWQDHSPIIRAGGWWLSGNDVPTKWDTMTVFGVSNPAKFVMSMNQNHLPHPDAVEQTKTNDLHD